MNQASIYISSKTRLFSKNTKFFINVPNSKGNNVSLLCDIHLYGILVCKIKIGCFKSVDKIDFINNELLRLGCLERKYIVIDNASINRTVKVREDHFLKNYSGAQKNTA
ncbi:hypothetical protein NGRA_3513 [Nosema granulosis]|uniref:Uncharacterized protein n=1 Tax=Nosema granulosis TaxID=83296 RepID=A0A9P6GUL7_9MICR|nr:hypothetical protein NGRA_3513 [Nosema granulosis]